MSENSKQLIFNHFHKILSEYDKSKDKSKTDILYQVLEENKYKPQEIVDNISNTVDAIDRNYRSLIDAKKQGKTKERWLEESIDSIIEANKIDDKDIFVADIKNGLSHANIEIGNKLFSDIPQEQLSKPLSNTSYKDLNKKAIINNFTEEIKTNTFFDLIINSHAPHTEDFKEIPTIREFYEDKILSENDKKVITVVATAGVIARDKGLIKEFVGKTDNDIARIADKTLFYSKLAYKVAKNDITPVDYVECVVDRKVAIVKETIENGVTKFGTLAGARIGTAIGSVFGPAGAVTGAVIGTAVGALAGTAVGKVINKGVQVVADAAKTLIRKGAEMLGKAANKVKNFFKSIFS